MESKSSRKLKQTEIGSIPEDWEVKTVKEIAETITDFVANGSFASLKQHVQYKRKPDYAILVRLVDYGNDFNKDFVHISQDAYGFLKKSKLFGNEIIVSNVGAYAGKVFRAPILNKPMSLGPNAIMFRTLGSDDFYYYWFISTRGQSSIKSILTGSAHPKFNKTDFKKLRVPVPPKNEQKEIAAILLTMDAKISLTKRINKTLEDIGRAIFKRWFVDFEFPNQEGMPYKSSGGLMVDSETGEIPEGWKTGQLMDICEEITDGSHFSPKENVAGNYKIATVRNMDTFDFNIDSCKRITGEDYYRLVKDGCKPIRNDILFSKDGTIGITFRCLGHQDLVILSSIAIIRPKSEFVSNYLFFYLKNKRTQEGIFNGYVSGSALPRIVVKDIKRIQINIPPDGLLITFAKFFDPLYGSIILNCQNIRTMTKIRDLLLPRLMSGKIRVLIDNEELS